MNARLLKEALEMLRDRGEHELLEEKEIESMLKDIDHVIDQAAQYDMEAIADVRFIPTMDVINVGNILHYDTYGKLRRQTDQHDPTLFDKFYEEVTDDLTFRNSSKQAILPVFEFLKDLWAENEVEEANKPDGTFNKHSYVIEEEDLHF